MSLYGSKPKSARSKSSFATAGLALFGKGTARRDRAALRDSGCGAGAIRERGRRRASGDGGGRVGAGGVGSGGDSAAAIGESFAYGRAGPAPGELTVRHGVCRVVGTAADGNPQMERSQQGTTGKRHAILHFPSGREGFRKCRLVRRLRGPATFFVAAFGARVDISFSIAGNPGGRRVVALVPRMA